jgi:acyl carrier protein
MLAERIRMVMGAVFKLEPAEISNEATPGNIEQWDSLRHMNLVLALEDEFGVRFRDNQMEQLISFPLIEYSLRELLPKEGHIGA